MAKYNRKHGLRSHPLYRVWVNIKSRCYNPRVPCYRWYGAKGISICDDWKNSPAVFIGWALSAGWHPGLEIDRKKGNENYSPNNCRCVTHAVNMQNCLPSKNHERRFKRRANGLPIGVTPHRRGFVAKIGISGRTVYLGFFASPELAAQAYLCARPS